jgi:hypothetical protein
VHVAGDEEEVDDLHTKKPTEPAGAAPSVLPVTVAESPQLLPTVVLVGGAIVVVIVGVVFDGMQPFGRSSAESVVESVPLPAVESVHVALQSTLMMELGESAASSGAVSV